MLEKQLRKIISECVQQILSEKKNILKVGEKPDPLHHLQGSKKISGGKKSKKIEKKEATIDKEEHDDCETCEDEVNDKVKVFHEKNDEDQHEATMDDFEFQPQKKSEKKFIKNESRYRLNRILFDDEV